MPACSPDAAGPSSTAASARRRGIDLGWLATLALALTPGFAPFSCTPNQPAADDELAAEAEAPAPAAAAPAALQNPEQPTATATRDLIMTVPQPGAGRVNACAEQVARIAEGAGNLRDMQAAQAQVTSLAAQDPGLYHYCFYQMVVRLDDRLSAGGPMMTEQATTFFGAMRELWLLARGLDAVGTHHLHFNYLRHRYVQLSRDYFGRDVQVVGPALGDLPPLPDAAPLAKPAGAAPAH